MPQLAIAAVRQLNLAELDFVAGEMHDARRYRHPGFHADGRQEARQKARAAGHVVQRELGAVAMLQVVEFADVAGVVKQRCDQRHDRPLGAEALVRIDAALVADQQARHRQRHVQRMLAIVIYGVHAVISGHAAAEQAVELFERDRNSIEGLARPAGREQLPHRGGHRRGGADLDGIRNVVIVTAQVVHR